MSKRLTFGELDELANKWMFETRDMQADFLRQSDEVKRIFLEIGTNHAKLDQINSRLNVIKLLDQLLEQDLKQATYDQCILENLVQELETRIECMEDKTPVDPARNHMYNSANVINTILSNIKSDFQKVNEKVQEFDTCVKCVGPAEYVAKLMMTHLYFLEGIESSSYRMMTMLSNLQYRNKQILACIECPQEDPGSCC